MSEQQLRNGAPDDSLCGQPLELHINDGHLHEAVQKAAEAALNDPNVKIIARRYHAIGALVTDVNRFRKYQARLLAAWKAINHTGLPGRLRLATTTATDVDTGIDWRWVFVVYEPDYQVRRRNG